MGFSLESIGMKLNGIYETIITTMNTDEKMIAAAMEVKCIGDEEIATFILEGSSTLKNIQDTKIFVVNITDNPMLFTETSMKTLDDSELIKDDDIVFLKDADVHCISLVTSINELDDGKFEVKAEVIKIIVNKQGAKAVNLGLYAFLESLINCSKLDSADDEKKEEYTKVFRENEKLVERVGSQDMKDSMEIIKENMIKKGIDL